MNQQPSRRLYRSSQDRKIAGVAGGIGEYLGADPTLVRVLLFLVLLPAGPLGLAAYVILVLLIPPTPAGKGYGGEVGSSRGNV